MMCSNSISRPMGGKTKSNVSFQSLSQIKIQNKVKEMSVKRLERRVVKMSSLFKKSRGFQ